MKGCPVLLPTLGEPCEREISPEYGFGLCEEHSLRMLGRWSEAGAFDAGSEPVADEPSLRPQRFVRRVKPSGLVHPEQLRPCRCGCGEMVGPRSTSLLTPNCYMRELHRRKSGKPSLLDSKNGAQEATVKQRQCRCGCGQYVGFGSRTGLTHRCYAREYERRRAGNPSLLDDSRGNAVEWRRDRRSDDSRSRGEGLVHSLRPVRTGACRSERLPLRPPGRASRRAHREPREAFARPDGEKA